MKLLKFSKGQGIYVLIPENEEDIYAIYRFIKPGDHVKAKTTRKISGEIKKQERKQVYLTIVVSKVRFYGFSEALRISGEIIASSQPEVSLHKHHSFKLLPEMKIEIMSYNRAEFEAKILKNHVEEKSNSVIILILDDDYCAIYSHNELATKPLLELNPTIPRKMSSASQNEEAFQQFFREITNFILKYNQSASFEKIYIIGPGFTKEKFFDYMRIVAPSMAQSSVLFSTKATKANAISELLQAKLFQSTVGNQLKVLEQAFENLGKDNGKTVYGLDNVRKAILKGAVAHLLISDQKLHESLEMRNTIDQMMQDIKNTGGNVAVVSSFHHFSQLFKGLGGIIAITRYPCLE